ncbi:hypothetical protein JXA02_04680 [candidate division KSB1 bacterium]|nr:hypothetical protein [candidate division KSB1 bacterium]RQW08683.1 MAG: hypothetical protein EH222_05295 [candidate division KSB1 bacterium]
MTDFDLIQSVLRGRLTAREEAEVARLKRGPKWRLLFDLIDGCSRLAKPKRGRVAPLSQQRAELLFIRLLSLRIRRRDAALFLAHLSDPSFYALLRPLLATAATPAAVVDEPGVRIRSDAEIYDALITRLAGAPARPVMPLLADRLRKPAVIVAGALACAVICLLVLRPADPLYDKYFAAGQPVLAPPTGGAESALRSSGDGRTAAVADDIKLAMASYMDGRYREALAQFAEIEKSAAAAPWPAAVRRDFYFYYGLSHLHLAGRWRQRHVDEAIRCLSLSRSADVAGTADSIHFFLALAYSLRGDTGSAAQAVRDIPQQSIYFEDARRMIVEN